MKQKECLLAGLLLLPLTAMAALEASDLRVESLRSPLGIDTQTHGIVSVTYGMTETQVIMGSGDYDLMLGEGMSLQQPMAKYSGCPNTKWMNWQQTIFNLRRAQYMTYVEYQYIANTRIGYISPKGKSM